jgi:16S rRNA (uracil1498-N3)-methyltransferase
MIDKNTKLPRLYVNAKLNHMIELDKVQSNYLIKVMRLKQNDKIRVFNGWEGEFVATLVEVDIKKVMIQIDEQLRKQYDSPDMWLLFSPLKNNRTDFIIEKATEIGVTKLQPILYDRSIVKSFNIDKAKLNIIQAAEQCERLDLPEINPLISLSKFIGSMLPGEKLLYMNESEQETSIFLLDKEALSFPLRIVIGPEGGFTIHELNLMKDIGISVHLGPRILRADTASLVALSVAQGLIGDMKVRPRF